MMRILAILLLAPSVALAAGDTEHELELLRYAYINFAILMAILFWKVRPALQKFAKTRHDSITHELNQVANQRAELQAKLAAAQTRLGNAEQEAAQLLTDSEAAAKKQAEKIVAAAKDQAEAGKRSAAQQANALEREAQAELVAVAVGLLKSATAANLDRAATADGNSQYSSRNLGRIGA